MKQNISFIEEPNSNNSLDVQSEANAAYGYADGNWACRADIHDDVYHFEHTSPDFKSFESFENKYSEFYGPDFISLFKDNISYKYVR